MGRLLPDDNDEEKVISDIRRGKRPSRPTNTSQNQWLQGRVWNTIATCWSDKPEHRWELSVVHHVFSTPGPKDALVEFPPVGRKNLLRLAEELLYTLLVLPPNLGQLSALRKVQKYVSYPISRDRTSPTSLSSGKVATWTGTIHKVSFPHQISL